MAYWSPPPVAGSSRSYYRDEYGRDSAWYIFKDPAYQCYIPVMDMRSIEDIEMFGMPTCGDPYYDKQMSTEIRLIMISIDKIMNYHNNGARISLKNPADSKRIYDRITKHLEDWMHFMKFGSLNASQAAPLEDLRALDKFAGVIYDKLAKYHFDEEVVSDFLERQSKGQRDLAATIDLMQSIEMVDGQLAARKNTHTDVQGQREFPVRRSMADAFLPQIGSVARQSMNQSPSFGGPSLNSANGQSSPPSLAELITRAHRRGPIV